MDYKEVLNLLIKVEKYGLEVRYEVANKILDALFAEYKRGSESAQKIYMDVFNDKYEVKTRKPFDEEEKHADL